jgi:N-acyl homoserine lactone hydrolase
MLRATHDLYLLHLGRLGPPLDASPADASPFSPVPGYLIRTARGRTILVDTGNPAALIDRPTAEPWWPLQNATHPEDDVVARLAELRLALADIDLLVSTHFDFDHCGRHDVFAAAGITTMVQRQHLDDARTNSRYDPSLWDVPGMTYTLLDGDTELEPGLRLLATPGHALGHQSVFVETRDGPVLLAIDAINRAAEVETGEIPDWYPAPEAAHRSRARLLALAAQTGAYVIYGHDAAQWATLPQSPLPFLPP